MARSGVAVALSGDGGDEVFSGYERYRMAYRYWPRISRVPLPMRRRAADAMKRVPGAAWDTLGGSRLAERAGKFASVLSATSGDDAYRALTSQWHGAAIVIGASSSSGLKQDDADAPDAVRRMMLADLAGYLPGGVLAKVDRAAMAVGLETRMPFLDHRLVEFSLRLPTRILRRNGQSKWISRELLARHVPRPLFDRPKAGFSVPLADWLRGPLMHWAEALLAPERLRREGYFDPAPIGIAWQRHLSRRESNAHAIWAVLMFQAWLAREQGRRA